MQIDILNNTDLLGFLAGTFTTIAFLPQVLKTWNTKSANDVSLVMFLLFKSNNQYSIIIVLKYF